MSEQKTGHGSWWATVPGVLTGLAALITAIGGLVTVLWPMVQEFAHGGPRPPNNDPVQREETVPGVTGGLTTDGSATTPRLVDGVWISIVEVRRGTDQNRATQELHYRARTSANTLRHDPAAFLRLVANDRLIAPIWTPPPMDLLPNSEQYVRVIFPAPGGNPPVFRFGVEQPALLSPPS